MRLGIDLDGVVADFSSGWTERYNDEFGADLSAADIVTWSAMPELTHFDDMDEFWAWAEGGERQSVFRYLEPYPGALDALEQLSRNHDVVIITTKPNWAIHDTYAWIADYQIPTREVHMTAKKWLVDCDLYLDDAVHNLVRLVDRRPDRVVCRFVRPWNKLVPGTRQVEDWDEFVALVEGIYC